MIGELTSILWAQAGFATAPTIKRRVAYSDRVATPERVSFYKEWPDEFPALDSGSLVITESLGLRSRDDRAVIALGLGSGSPSGGEMFSPAATTRLSASLSQ